MRIHAGTSGFAYKEWKPTFYPEDLAASGFLRYYAERLQTVEINNSFYRMPSRKVVDGWAAEVPEHFRFAVKASRRITHFKRLNDVAGELEFLFGNLTALGGRLGPVLFQLPPNMVKDVARLRDFLMQLPPGRSHVLEFRHSSWFDDEVYDALRESGVALCVTEDEDVCDPIVTTAKFGYLRLRRDSYGKPELQEWVERVRSQGWKEVYVYFKHETSAPNLALELAALGA
jgi:uncharacterized protein YecE (DUF72 family)